MYKNITIAIIAIMSLVNFYACKQEDNKGAYLQRFSAADKQFDSLANLYAKWVAETDSARLEEWTRNSKAWGGKLDPNEVGSYIPTIIFYDNDSAIGMTITVPEEKDLVYLVTMYNYRILGYLATNTAKDVILLADPRIKEHELGAFYSLVMPTDQEKRFDRIHYPPRTYYKSYYDEWTNNYSSGMPEFGDRRRIYYQYADGKITETN